MSPVIARKFSLRFREFASIDEAAGIVRDVAVITVGPALGHGLHVDATTLEQVKACAEQYQNGIKVKMNHDGGAGDIVGFLTNFRVTGDRLLADLNLLKSSSRRAYILEIAATIPDTFGLSIAFSGPVEDVGELRMARCIEIYSADLVSEPAANPTGLFDVGPISKGDNPDPSKLLNKQNLSEMNPEDIQKIIDEALSAFAERLNKLEAAAPVVDPVIEPQLAADPVVAPVEDPAKALAAIADASATRALELFAKRFGAPVALVSAPSQAPALAPVAQNFEELVRTHPDYAKNKAFAITDSVSKHGAAHTEYLGRVRVGGDVILF